jgi:hypothetical protein
MILTIVVLSFWFIFPLAMFLSVSHVDKNTDQVVRLGRLRHGPQRRMRPERHQRKRPVYGEGPVAHPT